MASGTGLRMAFATDFSPHGLTPLGTEISGTSGTITRQQSNNRIFGEDVGASGERRHN